MSDEEFDKRMSLIKEVDEKMTKKEFDETIGH